MYINDPVGIYQIAGEKNVYIMRRATTTMRNKENCWLKKTCYYYFVVWAKLLCSSRAYKTQKDIYYYIYA